ncbi:hypothetical protein OBBRIDRAFT_888553 [Obba rivulosa]|uniref:Uncharacterized protein n=1 Tax=Obba rivulosa TaxID=1052685 RepID=A0A8E2ARE1_9APHY|nr:hypothetical protein OBBRIDRAFT_888553 [Obba rivulosa]
MISKQPSQIPPVARSPPSGHYDRPRRVDLTQPSPLARYPELPLSFKDHEHHYMLGWPASKDFLEQFFLRCAPGITKIYMPGSCRCSVGVRCLRHLSGCDDCSWAEALPVDAPIPQDTQSPNPISTLPILCIAHTGSARTLIRRVTEAQYDWFVQQFGKEPQWYKDALA